MITLAGVKICTATGLIAGYMRLCGFKGWRLACYGRWNNPHEIEARASESPPLS